MQDRLQRISVLADQHCGVGCSFLQQSDVGCLYVAIGPNQIEGDLAADQEPRKAVCESHTVAEDVIHFPRLADQWRDKSKAAGGDPAFYDSRHALAPYEQKYPKIGAGKVTLKIGEFEPTVKSVVEVVLAA
jgi:hypothetical protein